MSVLPIATASMPVNAVVYVLDGVMVGASEFAYMATAMVGAAGCAVAALVAAEGADMGLEGVWACLAVLMAGRAATLLWRFHSPNSALHVPPEVTRRALAAG